MKRIPELIKNTYALSAAIIILVLTCSFILPGCADTATTHSNKAEADASTIKQPDSTNHIQQQKELEKIYSLAIGDCIRLVKKEYKLSFDTLFFGKRKFGQPDDFPDITLPAVIEHTNIRLISPEDGEKKQKESMASFYINLMGRVYDDDATFMFVFFSKGFAHQFDCFIQYRHSAGNNTWKMETSRFENYQYPKKP